MDFRVQSKGNLNGKKEMKLLHLKYLCQMLCEKQGIMVGGGLHGLMDPKFKFMALLPKYKIKGIVY